MLGSADDLIKLVRLGSDILKEVKARFNDAEIPTKLSSEIKKQSLGAPPPHPTLYDGSRGEALLNVSASGVQRCHSNAPLSLIENKFLKSSQHKPC